jgi:hypothetical protein
MAVKKDFKKFNIDRHNLGELVKQTNIPVEIQEIVNLAIEDPTNKKIDYALDTIRNEDRIKTIDKNEIEKKLLEFRDNYMDLFNLNNCPSPTEENYEQLKQEAKFFAGMTGYNFILMAQRVKAIRDYQLYKIDNYPDFKSFIEKELSINRQTVYKYIDIINYFGVSSMRHEGYDYSKLIPFIPIIKFFDNDEQREDLKLKIINDSKKKSQREMQEEARELKIKYGLVKAEKESDLGKAMNKFLKAMPSTLTIEDKEILHTLRDLINRYL